MNKIILTVCIDCGKANDHKHKSSLGVWTDTCDMCGKNNVSCASAPHDFGIYSNEEIKAHDEIQDLI